MIYGIGIDIEKIERVRRLLAEHNELIARIYTRSEQDRAGALSKEGRIRFYAAAFAAKEAVMKSLRTGWSEQVNWAEIEGSLSESAVASLFGNSKLYAAKIGVARITVNFITASAIVVATAVAEK